MGKHAIYAKRAKRLMLHKGVRIQLNIFFFFFSDNRLPQEAQMRKKGQNIKEFENSKLQGGTWHY